MKRWSVVLSAAFVLGLSSGSLLAYVSTRGYIGTLERMMGHYRTEFDYYFDGANKRGYIELCTTSAGEFDVVFKDECLPTLKQLAGE